MKLALVNPNWRFAGSIYFGCQEPHLPLEFGYAQALLERAGHDVLLVDAALEELNPAALQDQIAAMAPDITVIATAPSYLFWRCPPPELRVPQDTAALLRPFSSQLVLVGPHPSTTPWAALRKTGADIAVLGECEAVLTQLAERPRAHVDGIAYFAQGQYVRQGHSTATDLAALPALTWPARLIQRHRHHHHRFDDQQYGYGAEVESSRGCPYSCTFCAKSDHRDAYRKRPVDVVLTEIDRLIEQGVGYVYFIDEIFLPNMSLLAGLAARSIKFGIQTRIDLWKPEQLDLLGQAGCMSIEAGVESISPAGRQLLNKRCKLSTAELQALLLRARQTVPFVQASLLDAKTDDPQAIEHWREQLLENGVWANKPVPMFPYPGSPDYFAIWGPPDDRAWERAVDHYLEHFSEFSDIQHDHPLPLHKLERTSHR